MNRPKDVLTNGAVRPWHVIFILLVAYVVADITANKLVRGLDATPQGQLFPLLNSTLNALICIAFVAVVPEFRRALPIVYGAPLARPHASDLSWAFLAMLCWGYGAYPSMFVAPLLQVKPEWFAAMGLSETIAPLSARHLAIAFGSVLLAPIGEELMFRGLLMNLWIARWGVWGGVIASSIVFGLFHRQHALFAAVMGLAFALIYLKYDSLWPGIAMHATYNLLAFPGLLGRISLVKDRNTIQDLTNWIPAMIIAAAFFPVAWQFWRRFRPAS